METNPGWALYLIKPSNVALGLGKAVINPGGQASMQGGLSENCETCEFCDASA